MGLRTSLHQSRESDFETRRELTKREIGCAELAGGSMTLLRFEYTVLWSLFGDKTGGILLSIAEGQETGSSSIWIEFPVREYQMGIGFRNQSALSARGQTS